MSESPDIRYGRVLEGAHIAGYTFARMQREIVELLQSDEWQKVGSGFDHPNDFMRSIDLSAWKIEDRPNFVRALKTAESRLSNRAIAAAVGVDEITVRRDVAPDDVAEPVSDPSAATNVAPAFSEGEKAAKLADKSAARGERDQAKAAERKVAQEAAREEIAAIGEEEAYQIEVGDIHSWRPADVSCIVTDPPYITDDAVELHSELADFALDVLPTHGALVVMTWQPLLPAVFAAMQRDHLIYRWTVAWSFGTKERTPERVPRVFDGWKPVLVFHKDGWTDETTYLYDVVVSQDADKDHHAWGQSLEGFRQLVRAVSEPGDLVCDPFVGGGTTALAALKEDRRFIGIDVSIEAVQKTKDRLAA